MPLLLKKLFFFIFILFTCLNVHSQGSCPSNIDFEMGNFTGWLCKTGVVSLSAGQNTITWTGNAQVTGRHTIIPASTGGTDFYGNFPVSCPNGSGFSVKLGNTGTGQQAEGIFYNYTIPVNATNFSLLYQYAVVFQDPINHMPQEQPRFQARIVNLTDNTQIGCVSFDFTADASLPGFQVSPQSTPSNTILYKGWTPVTLDLSGYAGKTIQLEFITSDCTRGAHFGYAYVDVNSSCSGAIIGSTICSGDSAVSLTAPFGYESYVWYSDNSFSQIIGNNQVLNLNPAPLTGAIYPVIVTPYPGFGCVDTVFASITTAPKPHSNAGSDQLACKYQQVPLGATPNSAYSYAWTPASFVTDPHIANPSGFITSFAPVDFVVKTTDIQSGCSSFDTVNISPKVLDTAIQILGKTNYCQGETINTVLQITNSSRNIQWYNDATPLAGEINTTFSPAGSGLYWAQFSQYGCTDSTRVVPFTVHPVPTASFTVDKDTQCITNNSFVFTNGSTIIDNSTLSYMWKFGDGSISQQASPVIHFGSAGVYPVKLIAASSSACQDSIAGVVYVMPNAFPEFAWDSVCTNRPARFTNLTNENASTSVSYLWNFGNGLTSSLKNPVPFTYDSAGILQVSLKVTALGCETDPNTIQHEITANEAAPGIKYPDKTVAAGYRLQISARDSKGEVYKWNPASQLSNANVRAPFFNAVNDVMYQITVVDKHTCVITDTLQMFVLKKKGFYLPNAFTPNGDGLNDVVRPYIVGMKALKKFSVYNRWGNLVFSTNTDGEAWNGTYKGTPLDTGSFVWVLEYIDTDNKTVVQKGSIMLIR